jgi:signal transduction histidine kinase
LRRTVDDRYDAMTTDPLRTGHTDVMLRTATWFIRVAAIAVVGIETFTGSTASGSTLIAQIVAYTLGSVLVASWWAMTRWREPQFYRPAQLPVLLSVMAACSAVCTTRDAGAMVTFGAFAALGAGSDTGVIAGWTVTAIGVLAIEIGGLVAGASTSAMVGYPLLLIVALLAGHNRRAYRLQAEQSAVMLEQVEQLHAEQHQVSVLGERNRIAREIHDVLAHSLGALSIQIQASRVLLSEERDVDRALNALDTAQRMVTDGLTETRRAVLALRTDTQPLTDQLALLAATHRGQHHVPVTVEITGDSHRLAPDAELALLRTAQESLVNAAKHSPGQPVTARLDYRSDDTRLTVANQLSDAGETSQSFGTIDGGYGLLGMRERLLLLDGSLTAGPDGDHWTVTAQVPQ